MEAGFSTRMYRVKWMANYIDLGADPKGNVNLNAHTSYSQAVGNQRK